MQTSGIDSRAGESDQKSRELLETARQSLGDVQTDLQPHIDGSTSTVNQIKDINARSDKQTTSINLYVIQGVFIDTINLLNVFFDF